MYLARFTLTGTESPPQSEAELLHDALWAHVGPDHGVEHITATAIPAGIDLVLFLSHDIPDPPRYAAHLLETATHTSLLLARWRVTHPLAPPAEDRTTTP